MRPAENESKTPESAEDKKNIVVAFDNLVKEVGALEANKPAHSQILVDALVTLNQKGRLTVNKDTVNFAHQVGQVKGVIDACETELNAALSAKDYDRAIAIATLNPSLGLIRSRLERAYYEDELKKLIADKEEHEEATKAATTPPAPTQTTPDQEPDFDPEKPWDTSDPNGLTPEQQQFRDQIDQEWEDIKDRLNLLEYEDPGSTFGRFQAAMDLVKEVNERYGNNGNLDEVRTALEKLVPKIWKTPKMMKDFMDDKEIAGVTPGTTSISKGARTIFYTPDQRSSINAPTDRRNLTQEYRRQIDKMHILYSDAMNPLSLDRFVPDRDKKFDEPLGQLYRDFCRSMQLDPNDQLPDALKPVAP